ncbi:MAG: A/G-specific adenine glycosylase [Arenicella sp.]
MTEFTNHIIQWHLQHGRHDLPWQGTTDPYKIWVSEIMLQQTQVTTVIPYFERFMQRFPTVQALASASIDDVLHLWTGLGYYARGRNLHKAAQQVVNDFQGEFPQTLDEMMSLSGIGRSTAGAILSFAFSLSHPILDGNVKRVLSRVFGVEGWYGQSAVAKEFWQLATEHTPQQNVATYTQAIMDFGATLCTRSKPNCTECPLNSNCVAFQEGRTAELPSKKPKKKIPTKSCQMVIIRNANQHILLEQRPPNGIWGGLWSLPELNTDACVTDCIYNEYGLRIDTLKNGTSLRHTFSHYHLDIQTVVAELHGDNSHPITDKNTLWIDLHKPIEVGLPAPVKKLLTALS